MYVPLRCTHTTAHTRSRDAFRRQYDMIYACGTCRPQQARVNNPFDQLCTTKVLTAICQQIWIKRIWPKQWKESIYVPIPKKGDPRIRSNNRTIALISHASKVMLKVIQHRLDMYMKQEMAIEQAGFAKGRGTRDQISNLRWIMERSTEYQRPIYIIMCFIDY